MEHYRETHSMHGAAPSPRALAEAAGAQQPPRYELTEAGADALSTDWKHVALEAMRYLTAEQIAKVAAASGVQAFFCARGSDTATLSEVLDGDAVYRRSDEAPQPAPVGAEGGETVEDMAILEAVDTFAQSAAVSGEVDDNLRLVVVARVRALEAELDAMTDAMQSDVAELLRALGLGDHARPVSPHEVVQTMILPALRARLAAPQPSGEPARLELPAAIEMAIVEWANPKTVPSGRADDAMIHLATADKRYIGTLTLGWFREHTSVKDGEDALRVDRAGGEMEETEDEWTGLAEGERDA